MSAIGTSLRGAFVVALLLFAPALVASVAAADDAERGALLFENCVQCHGKQGHGDRLALAPAIAGLPQWYVESQLGMFRSGARGDHPQDIPGLRMRPMSRSLHSDEDVKLVAAFVASLPPVDPVPVIEGGDPQRGAAKYNAVCAVCHGADGTGNQAVNAPGLRNMNDWYLVSALERYRAGIRGSDPANPSGLLMKNFATQLADDQEIRDVVAFITTLND
jgi:cytochrome c oxidase subunit 2